MHKNIFNVGRMIEIRSVERLFLLLEPGFGEIVRQPIPTTFADQPKSVIASISELSGRTLKPAGTNGDCFFYTIVG